MFESDPATVCYTCTDSIYRDNKSRALNCITSLLLCLLLVLKRKAWNSPVKRLTLIVTACTGLAGYVYASAELYNNSIWNKVFNLVTSVTLLYLFVILAVLLFKIGATIVPGEWKHSLVPRLSLLSRNNSVYDLWPARSLLRRVKGHAYNNSTGGRDWDRGYGNISQSPDFYSC